MGKIGTSRRQKISIVKKSVRKKKKTPSIKDVNIRGLKEELPQEWLLDQKNIGNAIMECLIDNDPEGIIEVINIYLRVLNKEKFRQKADIGKSTYYYLMKSKNPTIKTLAKIVHSMTH